MRRVLLCAPDHYGIEYEINPWMNRERDADRASARAQWQGLHHLLCDLGCQVELIAAQPGLPDMVFTANAGLVVGRQFVLSNFRHPERQGEAEHFEKWFTDAGYTVQRLPHSHCFEGEGDALFCGETLVCGYRFRSDIRSHRHLGELFSCLVLSVELTDDRFYHLDTCFCPLPNEGAIWHPGAFDAYGRKAIRDHVSPLIEVPTHEALRFACNTVVLGSDALLPAGCPGTAHLLNGCGYRTHALPMSEFIKAGGACKCLTLWLPQKIQPHSMTTGNAC